MVEVFAVGGWCVVAGLCPGVCEVVGGVASRAAFRSCPALKKVIAVVVPLSSHNCVGDGLWVWWVVLRLGGALAGGAAGACGVVGCWAWACGLVCQVAACRVAVCGLASGCVCGTSWGFPVQRGWTMLFGPVTVRTSAVPLIPPGVVWVVTGVGVVWVVWCCVCGVWLVVVWGSCGVWGVLGCVLCAVWCGRGWVSRCGWGVFAGGPAVAPWLAFPASMGVL